MCATQSDLVRVRSTTNNDNNDKLRQTDVFIACSIDCVLCRKIADGGLESGWRCNRRVTKSYITQVMVKSSNGNEVNTKYSEL